MKRIAVAALGAAGVFVGAPAAHAEDLQCTGTLGPVVVESIVVPTGASCTLQGTQVLGDAEAEPGSELFLQTDADVRGNVEVAEGASTGADLATIGGNYRCDGCLFEDVLFSTVGGSVRIDGESQGSFIMGNSIGGNVVIGNSSAGDFVFSIVDNVIGGRLRFEENQGPAEISGNTIAGDLRVVENDVAGTFCPQVGPCVENLQLTNNQVGGDFAFCRNVGPANVSGNVVLGIVGCEEDESS